MEIPRFGVVTESCFGPCILKHFLWKSEYDQNLLKTIPLKEKIRKYYNKTFFFKHPIKLIFPNFPPIDKN